MNSVVMMARVLTISLAACALLAGCAARGPSTVPEDTPDLFELAGDPVDHVRFTKFLEWWPVNRDWLLLRFSNQQYVLVQPMDPCFSNLREAHSMTLSQASPNRLDKFDRLRLDGRQCRIVEMRPVDIDSHRQAQLALQATGGGT
ncbi:MAG: DUF6491 family protein [Wenzhouxiangellaceae bacterium]